eukprot:TRINITY_DN10534_c0_g1_i1.p1 TRINITY_DN10534_c0_g1~~TRINITY_DN10534_c0_g1_i1.p1  ORF type:complete len:296 (-),score=78.93 TRINITY_DN10534_c0_g1_i1:27-914(-)
MQVPLCMKMTDDDVVKMMSCHAHIGTQNVSPEMKRYVFARTSEGNHIIDIRKTWEKIQLAARVIVAVSNVKDICAISLTTGDTKKPVAQRAVLKFANYIGTTSIVGRFTPGTFTNQIQKHFQEPRLLIVSDPIKDYQPILEASYVNVPVIAFANTDAPLRNVDIAIPCNTGSKYSVAVMYWLLAREVLRLRGDTITRDVDWDVLIDMFKYRDPEKEDKQEFESNYTNESDPTYNWENDTAAFDQYDDKPTDWDSQIPLDKDVATEGWDSTFAGETEVGEGYEWDGTGTADWTGDF